MVTIFNNKKSVYNNTSELPNKSLVKRDNNKLKQEYKNTIYYPSSTSEWSSSVYSYDKAYMKAIISHDTITNKLLWSYLNMIQFKRKVLYKRRRNNKSRYSSNKIFVSRAEFKHTNEKLLVQCYVFNKKKISLQESLLKLVSLTKVYKFYRKNLTYLLTHKNKTFNVPKEKAYITGETSTQWEFHKNKVLPLMNNKINLNKKWNTSLTYTNSNLFDLILPSKKRLHRKKNSLSIGMRKLVSVLSKNIRAINFNKSKFNQVFLNIKGSGLLNLLEKIYNKKVEMKIVEQKAIHLNNDIFVSAIALKLRDRKKKVVRVLKKALEQMVRLPDLHTIITFDDTIKKTNKNNVVNTIKQQVVSGIRFEASGRLTKRLTAMRAVFKYRYKGSLKNIRSSFNKKSSVMLKGYAKSNSQYHIINSKTRNGSFGLKGWVSSH